jgi:molecular chaperone DnaK
MPQNKYAVGIDLGTTYSAISYVDEDGRVETIRLEDGNLSMASAIYFESETEIVVGNQALDYVLIFPDRVARAFKRHMGEADWKFTVDEKEYRAEELSAMILKKLISQAEEQIGPIEEVVISVPHIFDEVRRRATTNAGQIAGVRVLDIVDEPVAGALAYGHTLMLGTGFGGSEELNELFGGGRILVYDLGGGTFDLTFIEFSPDQRFEVRATGGDWHLGGEDWDKALAEHLRKEYCNAFHVNVDGDAAIAQMLRQKAVETKLSLSNRPRVPVELSHDGETTRVEVSRGLFQELSEHLVDRTRATLQSMLEERDLLSDGMSRYGYIDFVLLIGGSSRMPMIRNMLETEIGRPLDMSLPPDTAVSNGAALFAAYRLGDKSMDGITIQTVNSHALGLQVFSKRRHCYINDVLIKANQKTETVAEKTYRINETATDISLIVLQGELPAPEDCVELGRTQLANVTPEVLKGATADVAFSFGQNGMLRVTGILHPQDGGEAIEVDFDVEVQNAMNEEQLEEATVTLMGIEID